jgi:hypothetical protein
VDYQLTVECFERRKSDARRARWKIENETFNTLKNQGYNFEHNYGHGYRNLASVLAVMMILAFLIDQIQQGFDSVFQKLWKGLGAKPNYGK